MGKQHSISTAREAIERLGGPVVRKGTKVRLADGHWYRRRRGKLVQIPDEWVEKPYKLCSSLAWFYRKCRPRQSRLGRKLQRRDPLLNDRVPREKRDRAKKRGQLYSKRQLGHPRNRSPRHLNRRARQALRMELSG